MKSLKFKVQNSKWVAYCLLSIVYCLFLSSCAAPKISKPSDGQYKFVLEKWTRDGKVYEDFETKLLLSATFKSGEFREAYIKEYSDIYMLDAEKLGKLVDEERGALKRYHEFFLSIHTPNFDLGDLQKEEPVWALYLANDKGEKVPPLEVKKVKEKGPAVTRFYPYFDDWSVGYTVKFPLNLSDGRELVTTETKSIRFVMTGPEGMGELVWELK